MTTPFKITAVIIAAVLAVAIYNLIFNIAVTGSGGLGAVSAGFVEFFVELTLLAAVVGVFGLIFYWWRRRQGTRRSSTPRL